jgi:RimJ/RimL family protein N-acetyltransferase
MDKTENPLELCSTCGTSSDADAETVRHIWKAKDGTSVLLRAIEPDDFEIERDFVDGLSRSSCYMRLMSARRPTLDEMYRWTHVDRQREGAVIGVVVIDGRKRQIGVARYAMEKGNNDVAECAIVVSDAWQGRGLGSELLSSLIELARRSNLKRLYGTTLAENDAMVRLARRFGFHVAYDSRSGPLLELSLKLKSDE